MDWYHNIDIYADGERAHESAEALYYDAVRLQAAPLSREIRYEKDLFLAEVTCYIRYMEEAVDSRSLELEALEGTGTDHCRRQELVHEVEGLRRAFDYLQKARDLLL